MVLQPEPNDERACMLATFAATGDERGVRRVIAADPGSVNEPGVDGTTPLCAAALWGYTQIVTTLLEAMAAPDLRNESGPRWTALHAASLQEHGKVCMLLLNAKANPVEKDAEGVSPCDYASCSEAVWPIFSSRGCARVPKPNLVEKGVIRKASSALETELQAAAEGGVGQRGIIPEYSRPGSSYVVTREHPPRPGSSAYRQGSRPGSQRKVTRPIDILEEEDEKVKSVSQGLSSLGI